MSTDPKGSIDQSFNYDLYAQSWLQAPVHARVHVLHVARLDRHVCALSAHMTRQRTCHQGRRTSNRNTSCIWQCSSLYRSFEWKAHYSELDNSDGDTKFLITRSGVVELNLRNWTMRSWRIIVTGRVIATWRNSTVKFGNTFANSFLSTLKR